MIKIEEILEGFSIEDDGVPDENVVFISEEDERILYNQLEHLYSELIMIHRLKLSKMHCESGKCHY